MRANSDLQNLLDSTAIATVFLDAGLKVKNYTPAATALFHLREADRGRPLDEIVSRMVYGDLRADVEGVLRDFQPVERELELAQGAGTFIMRIRPYRTLEGAVDGVVITFVDISARRRTEEILREHSAIVQFSQDALVALRLDGVICSWNTAAERLSGWPAAEAIGQPFDLLGSPDLQRDTSELMRQALAGAAVGPVETTGRRRDGSRLDLEVALVPIKDAGGTVTGLALSARDIAERKASDDHRALLLGELSHRVKNVLATVSAIAAQTLGKAPTAQAAQSFIGRLQALVKTHDLMTLHEWRGAALSEIVETELSPYQNEERTRWICNGPPVTLQPPAAVALGMAFHELATNAAKYGAFSALDGRVAVEWQTAVSGDELRLRVSWTESGGPTVERRGRRGFGTRLIADGLSHQLSAEVRLDFDPTGLRCVIDLPVSEASRDAP